MQKLTVQYCTPDPKNAMLRLQSSGIVLQDIQFQSDYDFQFTIASNDLKSIHAIAQKHGDTTTIKSKTLQHLSLSRIVARPVLFFGIVFLLFLTFWFPSRIFFIQIEGNHQIPTAQIMQTLDKCGLRFGSNRKQLRSQVVKDALLHEIPQLQWAGINTNGCVAVVKVLERNETDQNEITSGVSSIVADHDGVVAAITVLEGNGLCKPGDAVKAGQVLISGYQDRGICIRAVQAEGEVYAYTKRAISAVSPAIWFERGAELAKKTNYFLILGKKRINFHNSSGILGVSCAKIYEQEYIALPGGFVLPIAIGKETCFYWAEAQTMYASAESQLSQFAANYLLQVMQAGQILHEDVMVTRSETLYRLDGTYGCHEMIGRSRPEENLPEYEDN